MDRASVHLPGAFACPLASAAACGAGRADARRNGTRARADRRPPDADRLADQAQAVPGELIVGFRLEALGFGAPDALLPAQAARSKSHSSSSTERSSRPRVSGRTEDVAASLEDSERRRVRRAQLLAARIPGAQRPLLRTALGPSKHRAARRASPEPTSARRRHGTSIDRRRRHRRGRRHGGRLPASRPRREHLDEPRRSRRTGRTTTATASSTTCTASTSSTATPTPRTTRATARTWPGSSAREGNNAHRHGRASTGSVQAHGAQVPRPKRRGQHGRRRRGDRLRGRPRREGDQRQLGRPRLQPDSLPGGQRAPPTAESCSSRPPGNEGANADSSPTTRPAFDLPNVISVAASDRDDELARLLQLRARRPSTWPRPGDEIHSTVPPSVDASGYADVQRDLDGRALRERRRRPLPARYPGSTVRPVRDALLRRRSTSSRARAARPPPAAGSTSPERSAFGSPTPAHARGSSRRATSRRLLRSSCCARATATRATGAALRFRWQRSRDASGHPLLQALRRRQEAQDRFATPTAPAGGDPTTQDAPEAARRQAPLDRAGLRLRRQRPRRHDLAPHGQPSGEHPLRRRSFRASQARRHDRRSRRQHLGRASDVERRSARRIPSAALRRSARSSSSESGGITS